MSNTVKLFALGIVCFKQFFVMMIEELVPKHRDAFSTFDMFGNCLDEFMMPYLSDKKFNALSEVYILIFCLSHGQSAIEHGFSANK